ncbi:PLC-like phosphodiesterase [Papiliotrema laurentii]|uniref:PLC-like phosphodiesterase n=1 Tax=Papiliotrema laurentii TaxID=5418 RepID=A0AAD9CXW9_PAPLA|nr:PLC-like phosphodiesterase [Papiliotrema laurentii]
MVEDMKHAIPPTTHLPDESLLSTPALSPAASTDPSPAFATILKTPDLELDQFNFDLGESAHDSNIAQSNLKVPECWGHRGASATYPENTRESFKEACKAGADGIETDIHITSDGVLVMFHDPELSRTTDGKGRIDELPWKGVLEHVRTLHAPHQPIPLFEEVLDILMMPENAHVKLNIDCKVENDPVQLFGLIKAALEGRKDWAHHLAPRIVLGLWHPRYLEPAASILPYLPRYAISMSLAQLRTYFFSHCHGFSVMYEALASADGARFRKECRQAGKAICAWTVNGKEEMRQCARWEIQSVISDKPDQWRKIKDEILRDRKAALKPTLATYVLPFLQTRYYSFSYQRLAQEETEYLEKEAGSFSSVKVAPSSLKIAKPEDSLN